jgi:hypothetical protein
MKNFFSIVILCFFSISCSSDLDFSQTDDLVLTPVVVANFVSFDIQASQFVFNGVELSVAEGELNFDAFQDAYFNESLVRADFYFEINNTIARDYDINLYLLDSSDAVLYTITFTVPAYTGTENLVTKTEIFEDSNLELLKNTSKIAFDITMQSGTTLTEDSEGSITMRSNATVYLEVQ